MERAKDIQASAADDQVAALIAQVQALAAQNDALAKENAKLASDMADLAAKSAEAVSALKSQLADARATIDSMIEQIKLSAQHRFGSSSEKVIPEQLPLFNEVEAAAEPDAPEPEVDDVLPKKPRRRGGKTTIDFSKFETVVIDHEIPEADRACPECGCALSEMKVEVTRRVRIVPAHLVVEEHRRHVYRCGECCGANARGEERKGVIVRAPQPEPPIPGSIATPSLLAWIVNGKYVMSLPLYRIESDIKSSCHATISRQDMANWMMNVHARWLAKVHERMKVELLSHVRIHADETTVQVLKEPNREAKKKSRMWLFCAARCDVPVYIFEYHETRRKGVAQECRSEVDGGLPHGPVHDPIRELVVVEGGAGGMPGRRLVSASDGLYHLPGRKGSPRARRGGDPAAARRLLRGAAAGQRHAQRAGREQRRRGRQALARPGPLASEPLLVDRRVVALHRAERRAGHADDGGVVGDIGGQLCDLALRIGLLGEHGEGLPDAAFRAKDAHVCGVAVRVLAHSLADRGEEVARVEVPDGLGRLREVGAPALAPALPVGAEADALERRKVVEGPDPRRATLPERLGARHGRVVHDGAHAAPAPVG